MNVSIRLPCIFVILQWQIPENECDTLYWAFNSFVYSSMSIHVVTTLYTVYRYKCNYINPSKSHVTALARYISHYMSTSQL